MQNSREKNSNVPFEWTYKMLCREKNVKPLPAIQTYLRKNCLRFCADHINLKDWSPILDGITRDRSLSNISVYSRCRRKEVREITETEEKLLKLRRCARKDPQRPALYTSFLLHRFVHSLATCLRSSLMITTLTLDGIPLAPKYLRILSDGLANNRNLRSLSLARCRIGDTGCDLLLRDLQCNPSLHTLNLSSCCLTNRSAACLSLFLKRRRADLLQNIWKESTLPPDDTNSTEEGLRVLILNKNYKFSDVGLRQLMRTLKNDFWLTTLCLRCCGITQNGGEIVLENLQANSVLTQIDLIGNEVSCNLLQTIRKILKKKRNKREKIPIKRILLRHKQDISLKNMSSRTSSLSKKKEFPKNVTHFQSEKQHDSTLTWRPTYTRKIRRRCSEICTSRNTVKANNIGWVNADKLKEYLSLMIKRNQNLIEALENSTDFLMKERNHRLIAEKAYEKIQPRLRNLRNKITVQNSIHSNIDCENQVYKNLRNVFDTLGISTMRDNLERMEEVLKKAR